LSTDGHGVSFWANTGRIDAELADGSPCTFFIKVQSKDVGRDMLSSEHESMKAIHSVTPDFIPKPIAWGKYESIPDTYFILSEYRDMRPDMPDPDKFAARLSALHQNSASSTGKFGFHVKTFAGNLPQYTDWEDSWETFFTKSMRQALDLEIKAKGYDSEFDILIPILFDTVIPRLLRPLESEGRRVKPSLVHGDLWFANSGIDADSDELLIFDACCFYAHNECMSPRLSGFDSLLLFSTDRFQMSSANGDRCATASARSISPLIRRLYESLSLRRTLMDGWISTNCSSLYYFWMCQGPQD
jgi:protein-ribulosamine 3-kinase